MNNSIKKSYLINFLITMVAISPAFALGDGNRNLLLIGCMGICPLFLFRYKKINPGVDIPLFIILLMMILFPLMFHQETMRWSTVLYSIMFGVYYIVYCRLLRLSNYNFIDFITIIRALIYAYCIVLIIQQFCVLAGLPIFNLGLWDPETPWDLNSLSAEPSHSARIVPLLMYFFICIRQIDRSYTLKRSLHEDKKVWCAFIWPILTMGSATAFLFSGFVILKFINLRKIVSTTKTIVVLICVIALLSQLVAFKRFYAVAMAAFTMDPDLLMEADHSGSVRIVPSILAFSKLGISSINDWFGYGVDADQNIVEAMMGVETASGGIFTLWINYGIIVCISFWLFAFKICRIRKDYAPVFFWFFCVVMYGGLNNQVVWLTLILFYTYNYISAQLKSGRININQITPK